MTDRRRQEQKGSGWAAWPGQSEDTEEPGYTGLWARIKDAFSLGDDEGQPWAYEWPYHPKYFRTDGTDYRGVLVMAGFVAACLAGLYFAEPSVRHVVDATAGAAVTAVKHEMAARNPPESGSRDSGAEAWVEAVRTVIPAGERAETQAAVMSWLKVTRPKLTLKQQFQQIDELDDQISAELRYALLDEEHDGDGKKPSFAIRASCMAGKPASPCLVVAVAESGRSSPGYLFTVSWEDDDYFIELAGTLREEPVAGRPWLRAVDLDTDGVTEIVETWHAGRKKTMVARVHKLNPDLEWECVEVFPDCVAGQLKVLHPQKGVAPRILIAEEVEPDADEDTPQSTGYLIAVYAWNRKQSGLAKIGEYFSDVVRT